MNDSKMVVNESLTAKDDSGILGLFVVAILLHLDSVLCPTCGVLQAQLNVK